MTKTSKDVAVVDKQQVATREAGPMGIVGQAMLDEAQFLVNSNLLPDSVKTAEKALVIIQAGKELGFPPMASFQNIYVVGGRPSLSGQAVAALIRRAGIRYVQTADMDVETDEKGAVIDRVTTIEFIFPDGSPNQKVSYRWTDANRAGYLTKDTWKKFPSEMMFWRCITKGARRVAPEAFLGLYEVGELVDNGLGNPGVNYNPEEGTVEVLDVTDAKKKI